jgi:nitroreductase
VGGTLAFDAAGVFAAFLLLLVLAGIGIALRRVVLERGGGTVDCGLRRKATDGAWQSWRLGVARYQRDELRWHQIFGVLLRPEVVLARRSLVVATRRHPDPAEAVSLGAEAVIVECREGQRAQPVELAMSEDAMTGFLAWLEAAPPGSHLDQIA